jgi:hypothetical protein
VIETLVLTSLHSLDQDAIKKFQQGLLLENDQEWHRLVDPEARSALPEKEVKRQSVLFELIKSEKDYVADLEILKDVRTSNQYAKLHLLTSCGWCTGIPWSSDTGPTAHYTCG